MNQEIQKFPVNVSGRNGSAVPSLHSYEFVRNVISHLNAELARSGGAWDFVIHVEGGSQHAHDQAPFEPPLRPTALIVLADEKEAFDPGSLPGGYVVFRSYSNRSLRDSTALPFPVGYFDAVARAEPRPFEDREINISFSGFLNRNRVDLLKQFKRTAWLPKSNLPGKLSKEIARRILRLTSGECRFDGAFPASRISFTPGFAKGLPPDEYASLLANTKIAICPPGFVSHETIRHWEAMKLGCVIISAPLPPNRFYRGSPIIVLQDWSRLKSVVNELLSDPAELLLRHQATVRWWDEMCSEPAVARYMATVLRSSPG